MARPLEYPVAWLLSLNVVNESPSLAYVVVIADKRGIVTIYACAFVVLCAGSATDLGAVLPRWFGFNQSQGYNQHKQKFQHRLRLCKPLSKLFCRLVMITREVLAVHCQSGMKTTVGFVAAETRCIPEYLFSQPALNTTEYFIPFT